MTLRIGEWLLQEQRITQRQLQKALRYQKTHRCSLGTALIRLGFVPEDEIGALLSRKFGVPWVNLLQTDIDPAVIRIVPFETARRYEIVPLRRAGATLKIAMTNPADGVAIDDIKFVTGHDVEPVVASETAILEAIEKYYAVSDVAGPAGESLDNLTKAMPPAPPPPAPEKLPIETPRMVREGGESSREDPGPRGDEEGGEAFPEVFLPRGDEAGGKEQAETAFRGLPAEQEAKAIEPEPGRARYVNLGFAAGDDPARTIAKTSSLAVSDSYLFWVEIGGRLPESIVTKPAPLLPKEELPAGARLEIVLFAFPGGLRVLEPAATGELEVDRAGAVRVVRQPGEPPGRRYDDLRSRRLFFRVGAPGDPGLHRLRCNVYYKRNLVQSHLVTALVTRVPQHGVRDALASVVDYSLSRVLDPGRLSDMRPQRLSVMLNQNDDGTHGFMFYGSHEEGDQASDPGARPFRQEAAIDGQDLQNLIEIGRGALRKIAWGDEGPWRQAPDQRYRYGGSRNREYLERDLLDLARAGYRMYDAIVNVLAGGLQRAEDLRRLMASHGFVQVALKERPSHVFPAALLYDYSIDSNADLTVCPEFLAALDRRAALDGIACFNGGCAARESMTVVCPGGFWGYRHAIGLPLSIGEDAPDVEPTIDTAGGVEFTVAVSTDVRFVRRKQHLDDLRARCKPGRWRYAETRESTLQELKAARPHLVYFYCHGGVTDTKVPFLEVGPPGSGGGILRDNLRAYRVRWDGPRPLVFLNGCHTTALEPEAAIDLVSGFVENCQASGVIGTEITIFEPLACRFAEEALARFFVDKLPIGEAVRRARLALLGEADPLGLVYIPFVYTGLQVT